MEKNLPFSSKKEIKECRVLVVVKKKIADCMESTSAISDFGYKAITFMLFSPDIHCVALRHQCQPRHRTTFPVCLIF